MYFYKYITVTGFLISWMRNQLFLHNKFFFHFHIVSQRDVSITNLLYAVIFKLSGITINFLVCCSSFNNFLNVLLIRITSVFSDNPCLYISCSLLFSDKFFPVCKFCVQFSSFVCLFVPSHSFLLFVSSNSVAYFPFVCFCRLLYLLHCFLFVRTRSSFFLVRSYLSLLSVLSCSFFCIRHSTFGLSNSDYTIFDTALEYWNICSYLKGYHKDSFALSFRWIVHIGCNLAYVQ